MKDDTSFIDLTKDEILSRIDINSKLIESFKEAMQKLQEYFNEHNYTRERDYSKFLERFLLFSDKK